MFHVLVNVLCLLSTVHGLSSTNACILNPCRKTLKKNVLDLSWQYVDEQKKITFIVSLITDDPSNSWVAFGQRAPNGVNLMTGPPGSIAAFGKAGSVKQITLNKMKYPPGPIAPITNSSIVVQDNTLVMSFTVATFGEYKVASNTNGAKVKLLFAHGSVVNGIPQQHILREGLDLLLWKSENNDDSTSDTGIIDDVSSIDSRTLRLYHGISLSFIWGFCVIVGSGFARYCRHKSYWFTAHKLCQSFGSLFTIPLTFLAYFSKSSNVNAKHYTWMHGTLGMLLGILSTIQGLLGTFAVRSHGHWCGIALPAWFDNGLRVAHRTLGKFLLLLAFVQIGLGIEKFSPSFMTSTVFGPLFIGYSSIVWATVIALELSPFGPWNYCKCRHKLNFQDYDPRTGKGFMTKKDLILDGSTYVALQALAKSSIQTFDKVVRHHRQQQQQQNDTECCVVCDKKTCKKSVESCLVHQWWNREPGRFCRRCTTLWLPHWIKFLKLHRSMSTQLLFVFVGYILDHPKLNNVSKELVTELEQLQLLRETLEELKAILEMHRDKNIIVPLGDRFNTNSKMRSQKSLVNEKVKNLTKVDLFSQGAKQQAPPPPDNDIDDEDDDFDAWGDQ